MPMVPEAAIGMLACARLGAIHSVVFGGFAPRELATRIDDARPKVILTASCGVEAQRVIAVPAAARRRDRARVVEARALRGAAARRRHAPSSIPERDLDWQDWIAAAAPCDCVPVAATDPLYILYTSGTTGRPKGVVRDHGGHAVALAWSMKNVYGIEPGEVFWAASDVGWVVGHSYIVYAPLLHGGTTILYEGKPVGTPDAGAFWRVIAQHGVSALFTAPTAFRAIKREDPRGEHLRRHDLGRFRTLFLAGERADPDTIRWAEQLLGVPVIDHWWQTETGWPMAANCVGLGLLPVKHGSPTKPVPGYDVRVVDERARELPRGETGAIVVKLPLPPGCLPTLWQNEDGFRSSYLTEFPGFYQTADAGFIDDDGYVYVMSRTDDIINVAGHRLSTGGMEEVLAAHPDVAECAVVGVADSLKGQVPLGLVVLKAGVDAAARRDRARVRGAGARPHRAGGVVQDGRGGRVACPRRARERCCAAPCAGSPTARSGGCRRPSTIPRPSTRSARRCGQLGYPRAVRGDLVEAEPFGQHAERAFASTPAPRCRARDRSARGSSPRRSKR